MKIWVLIKKLDPRYRGPYSVIRRTQFNNYILKNSKGKRLSSTFPLSKLKIVKDWKNFDITLEENSNVTAIADIERIINDRINNGVKEYLVSWEGYPVTYNSWIA